MKFLKFSTLGLLVLCNLATANAESRFKTDSVRLVLPPAIYAVVGHEMNIYFDNVILTSNIRNYEFDVACAKGRQDIVRWRFTPTAKDVGKYPFSIKVLNNQNKVIAEESTILYVTPADSGKGENISLLIIGDSLTDQAFYPNELNKLLSIKGNPKVKFIGSHAGGGCAPGENKIAHEGRGGWKWSDYCTRWNETQNDYRAKSPFLFLKNGKPQLDFQKYCDKYNGGKAPDFLTVFLGTNDIYYADDNSIDRKIDELFRYSDILVTEFQKVSTNTRFGIFLTIPPASTQDAFGANYKCDQTRWQFRRNQHRLIERMIKKYKSSAKKNIFLVPAYTNIDCDNNFPKIEEQINSRNKKKIFRNSNGVHPAKEGYFQIADTVYAWLKYRLNIEK